MTVSKSTRYALYAAAEMARAGTEQVTAAGVAQRYGVPEGALAKSLQQLVRSKLAVGTRGSGGGYRLARPAAEVSIQELIELFEPAPTPDTCMFRDLPGAACPGESEPRCRLQSLFQEVDETVRATFASVTLATLVG